MQLLLAGIVGALAFIGLMVVVYIVGNWVAWRFRKSMPISEDSVRSTQFRLLHPKWDELEQYFEVPIPKSVKKLYSRTDLLVQKEILFRDGNGGEWEIAQFEPADSETLNLLWDDLKSSKNLPFATDAFGDCYYIPLENAANHPVMYYHHDGGDTEFVSKSLDEFLSWRKQSKS
jgi:hypothetical protein